MGVHPGRPLFSREKAVSVELARTGCLFELRWGPHRASVAPMTPSSSERSALPFARFAAQSLVAMAITSVVLVGCGDKKSDTTTGGTTTTTTTSTDPAPSAVDTTSPVPAGGGADATAQLFKTRCALCHGATGLGDGPGSAALKPKPRNFHDTAYMNTRTDAQLSEVIHQGKGAMPKWGGILTDEQITALVQHVRELGKTP